MRWHEAHDELRAASANLVREMRISDIEGGEAETMAKGIYLALNGLYTTRQYTPELADNAACHSLVRVILDHVDGAAARMKS